MRAARCLSALSLLSTALLAACDSNSVTAPAHERHAVHPTPVVATPVGHTVATAAHAAVQQVAAIVSRYIETALGAQPAVTPMLRIDAPSATGRVRAGAPVTIRVAYTNFDFRPELRTPNAGTTLGSVPQVVVDGVVQGHIHGYLQRIPTDGSLPEADATSFCVLTRSVSRSGYNGIAEGECPGVEPGEYRLSAEFQNHSHTAILKTGPRATLTGDVVVVRVR